MYALSMTIDVNPQGAQPVLTRAQAWQGLVMKAENPIAFVPGMAECRIVERYADGFLREVVLRGSRLRERITFTPHVQVHFQRVDTDQSGWIANVLSDSEHGLALTFTLALDYPGCAPGSSEERERAEMMKANYLRSLETTLATMRERVTAGAIAD